MKKTLQKTAKKEGELYKEIQIDQHRFRLVYGYYEDYERESSFNEPMPLYPDFKKEPRYTESGIPLVTAMQDVCGRYQGREAGDSCADCIYFQKNEDLFGFCFCPLNSNEENKA